MGKFLLETFKESNERENFKIGLVELARIGKNLKKKKSYQEIGAKLIKR